MQQTSAGGSVKIQERLYLFSLLFFAALLPFQFTQLPLTLGLMLYSVIWLVSINFRLKFKRFRSNLPAIVGLAYFAWVCLGVLYSGELAVAERIMVLKVPFGAWAILLATSGLAGSKYAALVTRVFVGMMVIAAALALALAVVNTSGGVPGEHFSSFKLLRFYQVPPHYFGMYLNFAYGLTLAWFLKKTYLLNQGWVSLTALMLMLVMIVLLSVRIQFVVFIAVNILVVIITRRHWQGSSFVWRIIVFPVLILMVGTALVPGPRQRLTDSINELVSFKEMVNNKQTNPRKFLWRDGMKVIEEKFWLGTGTGAEDAALHEKLKEEKAVFWNGKATFTLADTTYNYHNVYLQNWAAHGIVGLALLLMFFILPLRQGKLGVEAAVFLVVCGLSFITESMLQRQAGVLFFSFFYGIFFFLPQGDVGADKDHAAQHHNTPVADKN